MIKSFRHKGLSDLFISGKGAKVNAKMRARCRMLLDALDAAEKPDDMNQPGFYFHGLNTSPKRYSVRVTANYRITFEWSGQDAIRVDLEDYH